MGYFMLFVVVGGIIGLVVLNRYLARKRFEYYVATYGIDTANRIVRRQLMIGDSPEIVREMLGGPQDIDRKEMKTVSRAIWKYKTSGDNRKNQYSIKVTFDNGRVAQWEDRS